MSRAYLDLKNKYSYVDIMNAYLDCRRRKRGTRTSIAYEIDFERQLLSLLDEINSGTYRIGRTRVFAVTWPKPREIWAAQFRDRIVHHLIYNSIGAWYEGGFIEDTFSCIKNRGTLSASRRVERFCRSATESWAREAWFLQVDIANFFVSIDRTVLWGILRADIGEDSLTAHLVKQIVFHDPTIDPIVRRGSDFSMIPRQKSLWHCPDGKGLPIGNLTSQFLSNVYLDGLDKFVKHVLKARWYARYVDDAVFLSHDRDQLHEWAKAVDTWLQEHRGLRLHPKKTKIAPIRQGIDFVGRIVLPYRAYPRRMTVQSAKQCLDDVRKNPLSETARDSLQSYIGIMRHSNSFGLRKYLCERASLPMTIGHDAEMTKLIKLY